MENKHTLLNLLISNDALKTRVCDLLNQGLFDENVQLSCDVTLTIDDIVSKYIHEIHQEAQWLLKEETTAELSAAADVSKDATADRSMGSISPKKSTRHDQRQRPRVKLFDSPHRGENSPNFSASTPKQFQNRSVNSSSDSLASPLWPQSPGRSFSSPASNFDDSRGRRSKVSLSDFVSKELATPKNKSRRIKPTKVAPEASKLPLDGPFGTASPFSDKSAEICGKIDTALSLNSTSISFDASEENEKVLLVNSSAGKNSPGVSAPPVFNRNSVTHCQELETLADVFSLILRTNACDNLMSELYFLTNLLVSPESPGKAEGCLLTSLNNCAFFAVTTLTKIEGILSLLAATTLGLLAAQPSIATFAPGLKEQLEKLSRGKLNKSTNVMHVSQCGNVSFQCDTDSIDNFTSEANFNAFRKQRDALYNLLQTWEKSHNDNGFNFTRNFAPKVKSILNINEDPTNLLHLARLFRNQLLTSCVFHGPSLDEAGEELLELLPTAGRDRLSRLEARLSEPRRNHGPVPRPDFPGFQLFFKDFIVACGSGLFTHFLRLCLVDELLKLNEFEFSPEGCDSFADDSTQKRYLECVSSTRILAKFLAFSEYHPFSNNNLSEQVLKLHCATRRKVLPLFDVDCCLRDAAAKHRLVLTVPWIIAYLSLMDNASARLNINLWQHLTWLRRNVPKFVTPGGRFLLHLSLGWLFQIIQAPAVVEVALDFPETLTDLDDMEVVSEIVLNHVCPFLNELNALLTGNLVQPSRHIRPTLTKPTGDRVKHLELRLEECFIQNQSQSTRRCIQFVAERVASCCVKEMSFKILPDIRQKIAQEFFKQTEKLTKTACLEKYDTELQTTVDPKILEICKTRSEQALRGLLGNDVDEVVVVNIIALTTRQAQERVFNWLEKNADREKLLAELENKEIDEEGEDQSEISPDCIVALRDVVIKTQSRSLTDDELNAALNLTEIDLTTRVLSLSCERGILCMLVEILTETVPVSGQRAPPSLLICSLLKSRGFLAASSIAIRSFKRIAHVIRLTNPANHNSNPLERIFCPRNVLSANRRLIQLAAFLVDENLLSLENALQQLKNCPTDFLTQELRDEIRNTLNSLQKFSS